MSDQQNGLCGSCRHFETDAENLQQGVCYRNPPQVVVPVPGQVVTMFPAVQRAHKCGEHEPKRILTGI
jgi:hypothetical protein